MALKTMQVIQLVSGRLVTINAKDFDNEKYALPGEPAKKAPAPPPAPPPPPAPAPAPAMDVDTMLSALSPKAEPAPEPEPEVESRRGRRGR